MPLPLPNVEHAVTVAYLDEDQLSEAERVGRIDVRRRDDRVPQVRDFERTVAMASDIRGLVATAADASRAPPTSLARTGFLGGLYLDARPRLASDSSRIGRKLLLHHDRVIRLGQRDAERGEQDGQLEHRVVVAARLRPSNVHRAEDGTGRTCPSNGDTSARHDLRCSTMVFCTSSSVAAAKPSTRKDVMLIPTVRSSDVRAPSPNRQPGCLTHRSAHGESLPESERRVLAHVVKEA